MKEEWKDIPNYEGLYQVSNLGNVKSEITRKDKTYRLKIKILLDKYKDIEFKEIM